ncbi:MAG: DinB family protein [Chitinophagaceae bacterium]
MPIIQTKEEILEHLEKAANDFSAICSAIPDDLFFRQPVEKWSIAQNVSHLITSANMTRLAYRLPKFMVRIYTGKPNRPSRSYDELVAKYKLKLQQGGMASGRFVAKTVDASIGKGKILDSFSKSMEILISTINDKWKDTQFDQYLAPHPLLGKLTLRELCFFTIYHTEHHLTIIKERLND